MSETEETSYHSESHLKAQRMREMNERRDALRQLLKSAGWAEVKEVLETWVERAQKSLMEDPVLSTEDAYQRNVQIGEMRGHLSALKYPERAVEHLDQLIEAVKREEPDDERGSDDYYEGHPSDSGDD